MDSPYSPSSKLIYGLVIFSSAFLLFQVQPILGKIILPWFGGASGVWLVCLLFFQLVLLLGYAYAHWLAQHFPPRIQVRIHAALLIASLLFLPILPREAWKHSAPSHPALHILGVLAATAGLPYFLLSSTSPLLQAWWARRGAGARPYRLYAFSNLGSMLALLSYPFFFEPRFATSHQAVGWSWAYAAVALGCAGLALASSRQESAAGPDEVVPPPAVTLQILWLSLAACGSALLLAITEHLSLNIASVPLLWVIPLALYLLTFILCFEGRGWYQRSLFLRLLGVALGALAYALSPSFSGLPLRVAIPLFCACLFICCMFCHGELARLKPAARHLTSFYLMISLGGALGAVFVALVAPSVFNGNYELRIALAFCTALVLVIHRRDPESPFYRARWRLDWLLVVALAVSITVSLAITGREEARSARVMVRNFYGVLRVVDETAANVVENDEAQKSPEEDPRLIKLMNGTIDHGLQFVSPARRRQATSYYATNSGVGILLNAAGSSGPLNVGVIGLGTGTLAVYGRPGDRYRFYEINPLVIRIARREFTYLHDSQASIDVVLGDGRLSLEQSPPQAFDVLVVDAFSGDSIPVHLLTQQAFALYFRHLKPGGVLAVHISNQFLDLAPVVTAGEVGLNKKAVMIKNEADGTRGISGATWILVGSPQGLLERPEFEKDGTFLTAGDPQIAWTDDYSSLLKVLK